MHHFPLSFFPPTASLRAELNHLHATSIEHLKQIHLKENNAAKRELESAMEHSHKQVGDRCHPEYTHIVETELDAQQSNKCSLSQLLRCPQEARE